MDSLFQEWQQRVAALLSAYEHKVAYGNLRCLYSQWQGEGEPVTNLAVVYELPGGSTNQINQSYRHQQCTICYLDGQGGECTTDTPEHALQVLSDAVQAIPQRRQDSLCEQIARWFGEGKTKHEIFQEINQLLRTDFRGGSLTHTELKLGINYVLELARRQPHPDPAP